MAHQKVDGLVSDLDGDIPMTLGGKRYTFNSAAEYQSAGAGVPGSSGSLAPGISLHRKNWKVRMLS
jgi:hypothetical protein